MNFFILVRSSLQFLSVQKKFEGKNLKIRVIEYDLVSWYLPCPLEDTDWSVTSVSAASNSLESAEVGGEDPPDLKIVNKQIRLGNHKHNFLIHTCWFDALFLYSDVDNPLIGYSFSWKIKRNKISNTNVLMDEVKIERFLLLKMMNRNKNSTTNFLSSRSSLCLRNNQTCRIFVLICGLAFLLAKTVSWLA